ncbi:hypothetical protein ACFX13_010039 [Malus domestica]
MTVPPYQVMWDLLEPGKTTTLMEIILKFRFFILWNNERTSYFNSPALDVSVAFPQATPASTFPPCKATPASAIVICMLKGLTEPDYGSDASALRATATKVEGGWVLEGQKRWIGNSTFADVLIIFARNTTTNQINGFIVKKNAPGLTATKIESKIGYALFKMEIFS